MMSTNVKYFVLCICWGICLGQFSNIFSSVMNQNPGPGGSSKTGSNCTSITSCFPWCSRQMDSNGCMKCQCSNSGAGRTMPGSSMSGMNPMYGMNPMAQSGLNPMAQSGLNPMSHMFSGLSGGMSPMTGGRMQPQVPGCDPVPTTCPVPQPWCERIVGKDGCVKCICGKDLLEYISSLTLNTDTPSTTPQSSTASTATSTVAKTSTTSATSHISMVTPNSNAVRVNMTSYSSSTPRITKTTTPVTKTITTSASTRDAKAIDSCITGFYCTKICDDGYKTNTLGCPVCECVQDVLTDTPVDGTDPPGKHPHSVSTTHAATSTSVSGIVISCPGIFECALICTNGYKTSSGGCPLCACMS